MQSTPTPIDSATTAIAGRVPLVSMTAAFAQLPDPRRRQGTRHPLPAVLTLSVAALLCNHLSLLALAEWGTAQSDAVKRALGFPRARTPQVSTLHRRFRRLDPAAVAAARTTYFDAPVASPRPRGSQGVALDGKAQRGRLPFAPPSTFPMHAVSAFTHDLGVVLAQLVVDTQSRAGELTVAPQLIAQLAWRGRVRTGAALYGQRRRSAQVVAAGGDELLAVDANQPTLFADIQQLVAPSPAPKPGHGMLTLPEQSAQQVTKGHGRRAVRALRAAPALGAYLDWPGLEQVFELRRTWTHRGVTKQEIQSGITSLPPPLAGPARLLALRRGQWAIENQLHWVKDVTFRADARPLHRGAGPDILALLRTAALNALRRTGQARSAARLRHSSRYPADCLPLLGITLP